MTLGDESNSNLIPSRSSSSFSLSSQSTHYTDIFGDDDISHVIAEAEIDKDYGTGGDIVFDTGAFTRTVERVEVGSKRKRPAGLGEDNESGETRNKRPHMSQDSKSSLATHDSLHTILEEGGVRSTRSITRTETGSTAVASTPATPTAFNKLTSDSSPSRESIAHDSTLHNDTRGELQGASDGTPQGSNPTRPSESSVSKTAQFPHTATLVPQASHITAAEFLPPAPVIVAHSTHHLRFLHRLPWGVQWEIARYVNTGFKYEYFTVQRLNSLIALGKNATAAPEVTKIVEEVRKEGKEENGRRSDQFAAAYARERSAKLPWEELDREEEVLRVHQHGALGCNQSGDILGRDSEWYGGKVHFTAKVIVSKGATAGKTKGEFQLLLDRPVLGTSNRFMRRFGSRSFIRARIQKDALMQKGNSLAEYFRRPFVISGAVFRAFFAKEQNVFLFRTNETVEGSGESLRVQQPSLVNLDDRGLPFLDFIRWHNDLELNSDQTMAKWAARFALGLSNSVPGIRLEPENIRFEDDIICEAFKGPGKPPSKMQMTDGCGFASPAVMRLLHHKFPSWVDQPTAVQCRIGGAKGLLLVRHDLSPEEEKQPIVWLRPSQTKIKYTPSPLSDCILPRGADPAMLTLDVLRMSRMKTPARLSTETITNFAENGVPFESFRDLFQVNIHERVTELLKWHKDETDAANPNSDAKSNAAAMKFLWQAIAREGGVMSARLAREDTGTARASGYVAEDAENEWDDEDGLSQLDDALHEQSSAWWEDPISGCPSSLEETCMTLLDSGFHPDTCFVLRAKLKEVAKRVVKTFETRFQFAVPMSCSAFIVPDPFGVLGPGEIQVRCSHPTLRSPTGELTDLVLGDVLVTRHPCKVPSDVQKVRAVSHFQLWNYRDVIVVSTASHTYNGESLERHLASLTGGGDYDGDTMEVFWDPKIVQSFRTPDPRKFADEPPEVGQCLRKEAESVSTFLSHIPSSAPDEFMIYSLQRYLLGALQDKSLVGQYSTWWENSTYANGYDHPETVFLAYMFCAILDGSKTGVAVIPSVYQKHCKNQIWQSRCPKWKESPEDYEREEKKTSHRQNLRRPKDLPRFIMDQLRGIIDSICSQQLRRIEDRLLIDGETPEDIDLVRPWNEALANAEVLKRERGIDLMAEELERIRTHVEAMYDKERHQLSFKTSGPSGPTSKFAAREKQQLKGGKAFTDLPIEKRQDIIRQLSREFDEQPRGLLMFDATTLRRLKASYAYIFDRKKSGNKWSRYPWNVATRALCEIKAEALGFPKTVASDFYRWMTISSAYLRKHSDL